MLLFSLGCVRRWMYRGCCLETEKKLKVKRAREFIPPYIGKSEFIISETGLGINLSG